MDTPYSQPKKKSSLGKKIILAVLAGIVLTGLAFMGLVGYYVWQIRYGDPIALQQTINQGQFSVDSSRGTAERPVLTEDVNTYIRSHNPTIGSPDAPVTILAFIDFECPYCQRAFPIFEQVIDEFGPAVRIVFKHFPIQQIHPRSNHAGLAATCAQEQGEFWNYYKRLFEKKKLDTASLERYARDIRINENTFSACLRSQKFQHYIDQDLQDVLAVGARGTPTYFVNQTKVEGVVSFETWRTLIIAALNEG